MELTARLEQSPCIQRPDSPNAPGSWVPLTPSHRTSALKELTCDLIQKALGCCRNSVGTPSEVHSCSCTAMDMEGSWIS